MTEPTIFELSVKGRKNNYIKPEEGIGGDIEKMLGKENLREKPAGLPEMTENEVIRHFTRLSAKNHHIDKGFYPLGSCTMKYNPKVNEQVARFSGFSEIHPFQMAGTVQGALHLMYDLAEMLKEIAGMYAVSLQPAAGAQGEFCGLLMTRKYHLKKGNKKETVIIPDSAHGTNPASVTFAGYRPVQINSSAEGIVSAEELEKVIDDKTAAIMLTNPNTLGLFESDIEKIYKICRKHDTLMYMDGANLNALLGITRPGDMGFDCVHFNLHKTFSTPHGGGGPGAGAVGVSERLEPFLPKPIIAKNEDDEYYLSYNRPDSIGQIHSFYGNFANMVRAYAYILSNGSDGLREVAEAAIINANYLKEKLKDVYHLPFDRHCMHEFVLAGAKQKKKGVKTLEIAKRILDFGIHAPTIYFPLIVSEALMIEPTETENVQALDNFADILIKIDKEIDENPEFVKKSPHNTPVKRLDEVLAAKRGDVASLE
ncbi:MAG: glycine dehydrogenase subunit 2 [candidate division Zixibacteria bacterium]|nr:glycine dehydrogenase subunit 2 [candidate division Zixibacteria bacterium]NIR66494.1 glycine dehydrogenase subunit 2 [candidate division Zixibacteria bacterium]NIS16302.1 glycine dehydrogenase subunit 2 [candidate division Zixibacteria bacterium]NIS47438.1 glycine dehydrogenase subunit 2 [candidate division Zixibacteria bacterium]NIT52675.1 glycine dehydrogenase subunit 2 [candidate division Zixibacteria bacterium]